LRIDLEAEKLSRERSTRLTRFAIAFTYLIQEN